MHMHTPQDHIRKLDEVCGKEGEKLCSMKGTDFSKKVVGGLFETMKSTLSKCTGPGLLKEYSPWLAGFQGHLYTEHVEIPGI